MLLLASIGMIRAESAAGVRWSAPASWNAQAARPMRAATYTVPAAPGDKEDSECAVYYFGRGMGGSVDDNVKRWMGQFAPPQKEAQPRKSTINGIRVTEIDLSGTYTGAGGPMATTKTIKPGYRLLGAIVEAPEGSLFIKFTGPAKTVAANLTGFETLLKSLVREK
ncbi:MAG: hypothetical protein LAP39_14285 [Acidobacteriia bacterium]|nr:hypothetical protein [Terriglobia bacterium]